MSYPKWVQRSPNVGPVLCQDEAEEKALLDDWKAQEKARAKAQAEALAAELKAAEEAAKAGRAPDANL